MADREAREVVLRLREELWSYPFWYPISRLVVAGFLIHFRPGQLRFFIAQFFGSPFTRSEGERKTVGFWIRGRRAVHRGGQLSLSWPSGAREGRAPRIGCLRCELLGGQVAQARMRAFPIVFDSPLLDLDPRIVERNENVFIQAFLAQARIETLDVCVLDRLARFDELQPYPMLVRPRFEGSSARSWSPILQWRELEKPRALTAKFLARCAKNTRTVELTPRAAQRPWRAPSAWNSLRKFVDE